MGLDLLQPEMMLISHMESLHFVQHSHTVVGYLLPLVTEQAAARFRGEAPSDDSS